MTDENRKPKIDIGIACGNNQTFAWWHRLIDSVTYEIKNGVDIANILVVGSALPDHNKNHNLSMSIFAPPEQHKRNELTDANRQTIQYRFLESGSDYLFFMDDDTSHSPGTISYLLNLGKPFVAGLYFNPKPPYNPIAYIKRDESQWFYDAFSGYAKGALTQVDAVGMGCTLIHRGVFEKIREEHVVYQRPSGSLIPIHKSRIDRSHELSQQKSYVVGDKRPYLTMPLVEVEYEEDDNRPFPFFSLEYGRTEDMHFCELAANVGIKPYVDTRIICKHWKYQYVDEADYIRFMKEKAGDAKNT